MIVGVQGTAARMSQETVAAQDMLTRFAEWQGRAPESVAADTTYGNGEFLQWLADRNITPYMRTRDSIHRKRSPYFGPDRFIYEPEHNRYLCPAGQFLNYGGRVYRNRAASTTSGHAKSVARARSDHNADQRCLPGPYHPPELLSQHDNVRGSWSTPPEFRQGTAAKEEGGSLIRGGLKNQIGLRRLRAAETQVSCASSSSLAAVAQNIKRLVRFLSQPTTPVLPATT